MGFHLQGVAHVSYKHTSTLKFPMRDPQQTPTCTLSFFVSLFTSTNFSKKIKPLFDNHLYFWTISL